MSDNGPVLVEWSLSLGFVSGNRNGTFEIDRSEWNTMSPEERSALLDELYEQVVAEYFQGGLNVMNADIDDPIMEE